MHGLVAQPRQLGRRGGVAVGIDARPLHAAIPQVAVGIVRQVDGRPQHEEPEGEPEAEDEGQRRAAARPAAPDEAERQEVEEERGQHPDGDAMVEHAHGSVDHHDRDREMAEELEARAVHRAQPHRPRVRLAVTVVDVVEDRLVPRLTPEGVHGANAAQRLGEVDDDERDGLTRRPVRLLGVAPEPRRQQHDHRERQQGHQRERPVEHEHDPADGDDGQGRHHQALHAFLEQVVQRLDVGGEARDHAS